jgi:hypothetical protein
MGPSDGTRVRSENDGMYSERNSQFARFWTQSDALLVTPISRWVEWPVVRLGH